MFLALAAQQLDIIAELAVQFLGRAAVRVSAWDVVGLPRPMPGAWLARDMPPLDQSLKSNGDSVEVRVYGVSVQGGNVAGTDREVLLEMSASKRIKCEGPDERPHDLTIPVLWLSDACTHGA